jgi:hypothetical protein
MCRADYVLPGRRWKAPFGEAHMAISSHEDFDHDDDDFDHRRKRINSDGRRRPTDDAIFMAKMFGGEPEAYMERPAFARWTDADAKLRQAGYTLKETYKYPALNGHLLYEVLRYEHAHVAGEKKFLQRMPSGDTVTDVAWFRFAGFVKVIYRWPEVAQRATELVAFCEGEKDVNRVMALGLLATTVAGQHWSKTCARALAGRDVAILEDNDDVGRKNALNSAKALHGKARSIKIIRLPGLPPEGDVSDWLDAGHTKEELLEIIAKTPEWVPDELSVLQPHDFPAAETIPTWDFLYAKHLLRGTTSLTAGTGGTGKSSLAIGEGLAMTSGSALLGQMVPRPLRVLLINLEDDRKTMNKRVAAAMSHHQLTTEAIGGRLFIIAKGEMKLKLAKYGRYKVVEVDDALKQRLIDFVTKNKIDVVSVDPFVKTHGVSENDNIDIEQVVEAFDDVAEAGQCAVHLWHHTGKMRGEGATVESARGAKALTDTCRSARILETMSKDEAKKLKLQEPGYYFRSFNGKRNFAPPSDKSDWYRLNNVVVGDAFNGDDVGVVTVWQHPGAEASAIAVTQEVLDQIKAAVRSGNWRADYRSTAWVGRPIARALNLDPDEDAVVIKTLVKKLLRDRVLKEVQGQDAWRRDRLFIVVA